jgi:hypothetical protein
LVPTAGLSLLRLVMFMTGPTKNGNIRKFSHNPSFSTLDIPSNPIPQIARNRVLRFEIHIVPETATVRSCVVW